MLISIKCTLYGADIGGGIPAHTSDVLEFAAIHLSSFERYNLHIPMKGKRSLLIREVHDLLHPSVEKLAHLNSQGIENSDFKQKIGSETLVMIPYFAQVQWRTAESTLQNRPLYLNATYYSLKSHFDRFLVGVQNDLDYKFIANSGLSIESILRLEISVKGHTKLPVAMLQEVLRRIKTDDASVRGINYFLYVEADMMFTMRSMEQLMDKFQYENNLVLFPHRLMPYLPGYLRAIKKQPIGFELDPYFTVSGDVRKRSFRSLSSYSCCSDLLNCTTRDHWQLAKSEMVKVHRLYNLPVVVATSHDPFEGGKFRLCNVSALQRCPGVSYA